MTAFKQSAEKIGAGMQSGGAASSGLHELELFESKSAANGKAGTDALGGASATGSRLGEAAGRESRDPRGAGKDAAEGKDGQKDKDPFEAFRKEMQEQKEKERTENINKVVESIAKDGKLPENFRDMLRDYEPMMFAGFHGDPAGLQKFIDDVNAKLKESGSSESWTENVISLRDGTGKVTDRESIATDPIPRPGVKF
jgi:hypothetical protein